MDKNTDKNQKTTRIVKKPKGFHFAYSIDNHQPVQCTMISDQPFFYMDDDVIMEEEGLLSDAGLDHLSDHDYDLLESELLNLKNKIDAYDELSSGLVKREDTRFDAFLEDAQNICGAHKLSQDPQSLETLIEALSQSRMARTLLACATEHDVEIMLTNQIPTAAYDKKAGKILIRDDLEFNEQLLLCVQELRRHWQHRQGVMAHPLSFHPDQAVLINRAQLADLSACVVRCAWEYKLQGMDDVWARIENSSLADLGRALAREALNDFRTLNNGKAAAAVFETWFLSERCRFQDKKLIQAMLADYRGYVFDSAEASKMISIDLICGLGEQPYGKNYLAPYAQMILNDPVFTDIRDRANANFLWFIKFERSFVETEQELQSSDVINKPDTFFTDRAKNNDITEDTTNASAQIISKSGENSEKFRNNIIEVRFGNEETIQSGRLR